MSISYSIVVERFAERHYISQFRKKYLNAWETTWNAQEELFKRIETLIGKTNLVEIIKDSGDIRICKTEFRIAGPGKSRHASGNRCIIAINKKTATVHVLLVYSKGDLRGPHETAAWIGVIKDNYPEYRDIF